jgi:hypothetical protein
MGKREVMRVETYVGKKDRAQVLLIDIKAAKQKGITTLAPGSPKMSVYDALKATASRPNRHWCADNPVIGMWIPGFPLRLYATTNNSMDIAVHRRALDCYSLVVGEVGSEWDVKITRALMDVCVMCFICPFNGCINYDNLGLRVVEDIHLHYTD